MPFTAFLFSVMIYLYIFFVLITLFIVFSFSVSLFIYKNAFYYNFDENKHNCCAMPDTEQYNAVSKRAIEIIEELKKKSFEEVRIKSFDNLTLYGRLYVYDENADFEIVFHGYKSCANHDCGGMFSHARMRGHNLLLPDQRCHGKSEGKMICYGAKERFDCQKWCEYISNRFPNSKIIISGVSMGASTVLMASDLKLPQAVKGVVADCGFSSIEEIILKVSKEMKYNRKFVKPFLHLTTILFGSFRINKSTALKSVQNTELPILFIHGTDDRFVPYYMTEEMYAKCNSEKYLLVGENAGHGLTFFADEEKYQKAGDIFVKKCLKG